MFITDIKATTQRSLPSQGATIQILAAGKVAWAPGTAISVPFGAAGYSKLSSARLEAMDTAGSGEPESQLEKRERSHDWHTKQEGLRYI